MFLKIVSFLMQIIVVSLKILFQLICEEVQHHLSSISFLHEALHFRSSEFIRWNSVESRLVFEYFPVNLQLAHVTDKHGTRRLAQIPRRFCKPVARKNPWRRATSPVKTAKIRSDVTRHYIHFAEGTKTFFCVFS